MRFRDHKSPENNVSTSPCEKQVITHSLYILTDTIKNDQYNNSVWVNSYANEVFIGEFTGGLVQKDSIYNHIKIEGT